MKKKKQDDTVMLHMRVPKAVKDSMVLLALTSGEPNGSITNYIKALHESLLLAARMTKHRREVVRGDCFENGSYDDGWQKSLGLIKYGAATPRWHAVRAALRTLDDATLDRIAKALK